MLTLIRGLPGSGKSTLARDIYHGDDFFGSKITPAHFEADMFFIRHIDGCRVAMDGPCSPRCQYEYDGAKVKRAHEWCQMKTAQVLVNGLLVNVIVSNTFTTRKEMQYYFDLAKERSHKVQIITCQGDFGSIHNVPADVIEKMRNRWEDVKLPN